MDRKSMLLANMMGKKKQSYIQSDGSCYFLSGIIPTAKTTFEIIASYTGTVRKINETFLSCTNFMSNSTFGFFWSGGDVNGFFISYNSQKFVNSNPLDKKFNLKTKIENEKYNCYKDDDLVYSFEEVEDLEMDIQLCVFGWAYRYNDNIAYNAVGRIFSLKIYEDSMLVRDFIPAKNGKTYGGQIATSDCMFDKVNQQFYVNAGSGTFTYGEE